MTNEPLQSTRTPTYCQASDVADWLRIDIDANTDPSDHMVREMILDNEDYLDRETGHTWLPQKHYTEIFDVTDVYDYGRGMYIPLKHRSIKKWNPALGDKLEIWNGIQFTGQELSQPTDAFVNFDTYKGAMYIRGYIYTILRKSRFRITYRYGGVKEYVSSIDEIPRDIRKACKLLTCIDILSTDFKMSQIPYGAEGNIDKQSMMAIWQTFVDKTIWNHQEIHTVY